MKSYVNYCIIYLSVLLSGIILNGIHVLTVENAMVVIGMVMIVHVVQYIFATNVLLSMKRGDVSNE